MWKIMNRCAKLILIPGLFLMLISPFPAHAEKTPKTSIVISVRSSPSTLLEGTYQLNDKETTQFIKGAKQAEAAAPEGLTDIYVTITGHEQNKHFRMESSGHLWNEAGVRLILSKKAAEQLQNWAETLRKYHYGKMVPWEEVKNIVPNKSYFSVTDIETGLTFRVQRRAGSKHADVQPLTKKDTATMKQIYNNRWSWQRKAILVQTENEKLAASMNGMPHSGDGIPDNGFKGHFCIHFYGSTTHKSSHPDVIHQLMVHKAAGKLKSYLDSASPASLSEIFIEAVARKDSDLLRQVGTGLPMETLQKVQKEMDKLTSIRIQKSKARRNTVSEQQVNALSVEIKQHVRLQENKQKEKRKTILFHFSRNSLDDPWQIKDVIFKS